MAHQGACVAYINPLPHTKKKENYPSQGSCVTFLNPLKYHDNPSNVSYTSLLWAMPTPASNNTFPDIPLCPFNKTYIPRGMPFP